VAIEAEDPLPSIKRAELVVINGIQKNVIESGKLLASKESFIFLWSPYVLG
jgi:hypothetical protein